MKIKAMVFASYDDYRKEHRFNVFGFDMTGSGYIKVADVEVEFDQPPESVLVAGTVEAYKAEQQRIRAEAQSKVTALQQQIDEMLSLEYKGPDLKVVA